MGILAELYEWHEWNQMKLDRCPNRPDAGKHFNTLWKEAEKQLGQEFSEELRASIFAYMDSECCSDFQAGFHLGALLILELQSPAAADPR